MKRVSVLSPMLLSAPGVTKKNASRRRRRRVHWVQSPAPVAAPCIDTRALVDK